MTYLHAGVIISWSGTNTTAAYGAKIKLYKLVDGEWVYKDTKNVTLVSTGTSSAKVPDDTSFTPGQGGTYYAKVIFVSQTNTELTTTDTNSVDLEEEDGGPDPGE